MVNYHRPLSPHRFIFQAVLIGIWGAQLLYSDSYYVDYLLVLAITIICFTYNCKANTCVFSAVHTESNALVVLFSALFALMVTLSNYKIWSSPSIQDIYRVRFYITYKFFLLLCFFFGGFLSFWNIFHLIAVNIKKLVWKPDARSAVHSRLYFWLCFSLLLLTRSIVLFLCQYPGELTFDSVYQISQIVTGNYSNHHPYYHTQLIRICMLFGLHLFGNMNAAVATYSFFQIIFTSFCFSLSVSTMAKMNAPKWLLVTTIAFFLLMPYHIVYSITMWKDVPFACFVLLFLIFIYRCILKDGYPIVNYSLFTIAGLGLCLFRSNGFFVFIILIISFIILWGFKHKKLLLLLFFIFALSYAFKHPVLNRLNVTPPDTIESLSVPAQQIARVIREGRPLTDWETSMLTRIVDLEQVPTSYNPNISDPIKQLIREKGNQQLLILEKEDYIKLYFELGWRYPAVYVRAWIDQTKGYWNGGYQHWMWDTAVYQNSLGIYRVVRSERLNHILEDYLWLFSDLQILRLFISIGLFVWMHLVLFFGALIKNNKLGIFFTIPVLAIVLSLLAATPIYAEFRYIYSVFCILPMATVFLFRPQQPGKQIV